MDKETALMEPGLPQLRQMVLENTERINKNEIMINSLRMQNAEQVRKNRKRDEWEERIERLHREEEISLRASRERMDRLDKFVEQSRIEYEERLRQQKELDNELKMVMKEQCQKLNGFLDKFDQRLDKFDLRMDKFDQRLDKFDERMDKFDQRLDKFDQKMDKRMEEHYQKQNEFFDKFDQRMEDSKTKFDKEYDKTMAAIRQMSIEFIGVTGHIVEGLASSSVDKIFKDAGLELRNYGKNIKRILEDGNTQMEVDAMLGNDRFAIPVEVKTDFTEKKVKRFVHRMKMFRKFFPDLADKEILAAVAAINYEGKADQLAHDEGLLVIRVSSDDIFSLDPFDLDQLRRF